MPWEAAEEAEEGEEAVEEEQRWDTKNEAWRQGEWASSDVADRRGGARWRPQCD